MSTTYPQTIDPAQANKETPLQEDQRALDFASVFGYRASASSGLVFAYHGGTWGGIAIAADDVTATASSTNYVVVDRSTGAVSISTATTNWNNSTGYARLFKLVASGGAITNIGSDDWDWRGGAGGAHGSAAATGIGGSTGGTDNVLLRADGTGGGTVQASGVTVTDNNEIAGYRAHRNEQTGTTYTLDATDAGKVVELTNASAITLTVPNSLPEGWSCSLLQGGAGQVTVAAGSGATMRQRQTHTKLAGQWAVGFIHVRDNAGSAAEFVLGGDTAA